MVLQQRSCSNIVIPVKRASETLCRWFLLANKILPRKAFRKPRTSRIISLLNSFLWAGFKENSKVPLSYAQISERNYSSPKFFRFHFRRVTVASGNAWFAKLNSPELPNTASISELTWSTVLSHVRSVAGEFGRIVANTIWHAISKQCMKPRRSASCLSVRYAERNSAMKQHWRNTKRHCIVWENGSASVDPFSDSFVPLKRIHLNKVCSV